MDFLSCIRCRITNLCPFRFSAAADTIRPLLKWQWYSRNYLIFRENQPARGLHIMHSGRLALYRESGRKKITVGTALPGWMFGAEEILGSLSYVYSAQTEEETEIEFLLSEHLLTFLKSNPEFSVPLLGIVANQNNQLIGQILKAR